MSLKHGAKVRSWTVLLGSAAFAATLAGCGSPTEAPDLAAERQHTAACKAPGDAAGFAATLAATDNAAERIPEKDVYRLGAPDSVESLMRRFEQVGYDLDRVDAANAAVPRISVTALPPDLGDINDVGQRKTAFIATVLPLALQQNEQILSQRHRLLRILDCLEADGVPAPAERAWLQVLDAKYGAGGDLAQLVRRVDAIPPSLVIAQAAIESGWGTSRFAQEGNALFGERTYDANAGLVPAALGPEAEFRVRSFDALESSIETYAYNLNTSSAYAEFRALRAALRQTGTALDSGLLAATLDAYSERGAAYVEDVQVIIRGNGLAAFDAAMLEGADPLVLQATRRTRTSKGEELSPS